MGDVSDKKVINLTDLQRFKAKNDVKTEQKLAKKQDTLISGVNIKTINNESILGEGNISTQGNEYYDFNETDLTDQAKLAEVYNLCPVTLRVHTNTNGLQFYRLQNNDKTQSNQIVYSCLLSGMLIEFGITESDSTYLINVVRYALTPVSQ